MLDAASSLSLLILLSLITSLLCKPGDQYRNSTDCCHQCPKKTSFHLIWTKFNVPSKMSLKKQIFSSIAFLIKDVMYGRLATGHRLAGNRGRHPNSSLQGRLKLTVIDPDSSYKLLADDLSLLQLAPCCPRRGRWGGGGERN